MYLSNLFQTSRGVFRDFISSRTDDNNNSTWLFWIKFLFNQFLSILHLTTSIGVFSTQDPPWLLLSHTQWVGCPWVYGQPKFWVHAALFSANIQLFPFKRLKVNVKPGENSSLFRKGNKNPTRHHWVYYWRHNTMTFAVELISHKSIAAEISKYTKLQAKVTRKREARKDQTGW